MTYFLENPFATNLVVPETVTTSNAPAGGPLAFGPFDCSQFQGARFKFVTELDSPMLVMITWYDDKTQADAPDGFNFCGYRYVMVNSLDRAVFSLPHAADWMVIQMSSLDGGNFVVHWAVAHRQNGIEQWLPGDSIIFGPFASNPLANGASQTLDFGFHAGGRYAGPASLHMRSSSYAGFGTDFTIDALLSNNVWTPIFRHTANLEDYNTQLIVPPYPLRFRVTNNTGGGGVIISGTLVADDWRMA